MKRRLKFVLFVCVAVALVAPAVSAQKSSMAKASAAGTAASYRKAYETVEAGLKALGGAAATSSKT